jgi:hypothetical protein
MKVRQNGRYVITESAQDADDMLYLICSCGHDLKDHEYRNTYGSLNTYEVGRCLKANHCDQFKLAKGKIETRAYSYV